MKNPTDPAPSVAAPPVHFGGATMTPTAALKPYARNNRAHNEKQIELLAKNIKALGWRWPIIVSKDSGIIVAGHGRWMAAKFLGLDSVPVVFQSFKTPQDEEAFRIADNKIPELADIQSEALREVLAELAGDGYDMDLTGFNTDELEKLEDSISQDLAQQISGEAEYTVEDTVGENRGEKIKARLEKLIANHKDKLGNSAAIVLSADCNEFICVEDAMLGDFLAELRRYAAAEVKSPLAEIINSVHKL